MDKATKTLFGGALMTAGIATAHAAPEFTLPGNIPPYADTIVGAYAYDYYTAPYFAGGYTENGGFGDSYTVSAPTGNLATGSITSTALTASADASGNTDYLGGAFAYSYGYVSVTENATLNMAWDFTQEGGFGPIGEIQVIDWSAGGVLVFETTPFTAGSDSVDLFAGTNYGILVLANAGGGGTASASAVLVPAPGVMGVLGAAGLVATRRRR